MRRFAAIGLLLMQAVGLAACIGESSNEQRPSDSTIARYFDAVRDEYSGDRAMDIVAFMEGKFRVPGNSGFDASIHRVVDVLTAAGYVPEQNAAPDEVLTYRVRHREMDGPTWEPMSGSLELLGSEGGPLLDYSTNMNMIAINSYSTPPDGIEAELVYVEDGSADQFEDLDLRDKIVFGETSARRLFSEAAQNRGALGVLSYSMPAYTQPELNQNSIQFSGIPLDRERRSWGVRLSYAARGEDEHELSRKAIAAGEDRGEQVMILRAWLDWYRDALESTHDIEVGGASSETFATIESAVARVMAAGEDCLGPLEEHSGAK